MAETFGIGLIPWSPVGGGLLTGKYRRGSGIPSDSRYATENNPVYEQRLNERVYDVVERLEVMAQAKDCTIDELVPPGGMVSPFYQAEVGPHPQRVL